MVTEHKNLIKLLKYGVLNEYICCKSKRCSVEEYVETKISPKPKISLVFRCCYLFFSQKLYTKVSTYPCSFFEEHFI